jgi:tellurite resistance protein TerC
MLKDIKIGNRVYLMDFNLLAWLGFGALVVVVLILDLGVFHRTPHEVNHREALGWSVAWIALALIFNTIIYFTKGHQIGIEFLTGYLVEKSLSLDNVFIFAVIFAHFKTPLKYQHRVLFLGVLGAIFLRGVFIILGVELIKQFDWIFYVFGAILIFTAIKLFRESEEQRDISKNKILQFICRFIPVTKEYHSGNFFIKIEGKNVATPLFIILLFIELTDVIFAVDSIPAIFAITQDPFIIYTSNIFAIMGLRSLYFLLADSVTRFHYLKYGLAFILLFIGIKLLVMHYYPIPLGISLGVIASTLTVTIIASWLKNNHRKQL